MAISLNIITREAKGAPLTVQEIDQNFINLKSGVESATPPGFNFDYNSITNILEIDNTVYGGDLAGGINLFPSMGNAHLRIGGEQGDSSINILGNLVVDRPNLGVGPNPNDLMIFKSAGQEVLKIREDGVFILKAKGTAPVEAAGGMYFDGTDFWLSEVDA